MASVIDAHHHLWRFHEDEYAWIGPGMGVLRRDFFPEDLVTEMRASGVHGAVAVQARQTLEETRWLLQCADAHPQILGVVGWLPLRDSNLEQQMRDFAAHPKLRGLRHVVQDEPEDDFLLSDEFNRGMSTISKSGLVYDLLVRVSQMPSTVQFVDRHPKQAFVLDHLAKPPIRSGQAEMWEKSLHALAERPNVSCKLSGLVTEADWATWSGQDICPYLDIALEAFGPDRLMAGSDWPVCLLAGTYARWWNLLFEWTSSLQEAERAAILGGTAARVYGLTIPANYQRNCPFRAPTSDGEDQR